MTADEGKDLCIDGNQKQTAKCTGGMHSQQLTLQQPVLESVHVR